MSSTEDTPFRCRADLLWEIDVQLSLANLDWDDIRNQIDDSGVYGGVEPPRASETETPADLVDVGSDTDTNSIAIVFPPDLWGEMYDDLWHTSIGFERRDAVACERILADFTKRVRRYRPDDDVTADLTGSQWTYVRGRVARKQWSYDTTDHDHRERLAMAEQIVGLIDRHLSR